MYGCLEGHLIDTPYPLNEIKAVSSPVGPVISPGIGLCPGLQSQTQIPFSRLGLKSTGSQLVAPILSVLLLHQQTRFIWHVGSVVCQPIIK